MRKLKLYVLALSTGDRRSVSLWQSPVILVTERTKMLWIAFADVMDCLNDWYEGL
ncbi:MAG: hypothetical protein ACI3ZD_16160 [Prevotella sp.]